MRIVGIPGDRFVDHGSVVDLRRALRLDADGLAGQVREALESAGWRRTVDLRRRLTLPGPLTAGARMASMSVIIEPRLDAGSGRAAGTGESPSRLSDAWRLPSFVLLSVQLIGVLLYPFMDDLPIGRTMLSLFALLVLVLAIRAVHATPALTWISILIGIPVVILTVLEVVQPDDTTIVLGSAAAGRLLLLRELCVPALHVLRPLRDARRAVRGRGGLHGPRLGVRLRLQRRPGALARVVLQPAIDPALPRTWFELLFVSFTTLTSVGLSDVVPILPHARSVVMIEEVAGLMYVALVVSRIVGLTLYRQRR